METDFRTNSTSVPSTTHEASGQCQANGIRKMPSLSTFFKKRRSLQTAPAKDQNDKGDSLRETARPKYGSGRETVATARGAELEALARLADSSDEHIIAAPTVATGPRRHSAAAKPGMATGRLNRYVSTHDPFRRFRSRSTQFRLNGGVEGDARTRLSWPARRSTGESPEVPESGHSQAEAPALSPSPTPFQAPTQASQDAIDERPLKRGVSAREASLAALERPRAGQAGDGEEARAKGEGRVDKATQSHSHSHSSSSTSFGMQKLKRLPSLSLKRGFSRRMSTVVSPGRFILLVVYLSA